MSTIKKILVATLFLWWINSSAQTLSARIASLSCEKLQSIDSYETLEDSLNVIISRSFGQTVAQASEDERKILNKIDGMKSILSEVNYLLALNCGHINHLYIENRISQFYRNSADPQAQQSFEEGNRFFQNNDYANAILNYKKAIKQDKKFVFAIDNLAIAYRSQNELKKALKQYNRSLEIFPEGRVALTNTAVIYTLNEDFENAEKLYRQLVFYYPQNPEGYFGLGKLYYLLKIFEKALDNIFYAHKMYMENDSEYKEDSQKLIDLIVSSLRRMNKMEIVKQKAKEHNIKIDER